MESPPSPSSARRPNPIPVTKGRRSRERPLRLRTMGDSKRRREKSGRNIPDDSLNAVLQSYTPRQLEKVVKGLPILARVAIRSYTEAAVER